MLVVMSLYLLCNVFIYRRDFDSDFNKLLQFE